MNQKLINQLNYSHLEYTFLLFFFIIKLYIWGLNPDNWLVQQTESFFHMFWLYLQKKDNRIWVKLYSIAPCIVTKIQAMDNIIRASNLIARENSKAFCHTTTGFPTKWCLRNQHRNSIPMICHYLDLGMHRKFASTNPEHYPNLGSDPSSAWNFCTRSSLVILWGNQQW